jgi:hypothetical protein
MESHDRIYLDVLRRVRAAPEVHIGGRSFLRLRAFHFGYCWFRPDRESEIAMIDEFRNWIAGRYDFETASVSAGDMLAEAAESDERAFDLYFDELDAFQVAYQTSFEKRPARFLNKQIVPVSAWLDVLAERPTMYLPRESPECLRAYMDGYVLASLEAGHPECSDLEGFDLWIRKELGLRGYFRWESVFAKRCGGDERLGYKYAIESMREFRASKGPVRLYSFDYIDRENV